LKAVVCIFDAGSFIFRQSGVPVWLWYGRRDQGKRRFLGIKIRPSPIIQGESRMKDAVIVEPPRKGNPDDHQSMKKAIAAGRSAGEGQRQGFRLYR
jgi:hypothetical protein